MFPLIRRGEESFPVDIIILWCDGRDPLFVKSRTAWAKKMGYSGVGVQSARFVQSDELKYVLRSIEMYANWIRRVILVTNGQLPVWLNTHHRRLKLLFHPAFMPLETLPTFNSCAIVSALCKRLDVSEHFLIANDDTFFGRPIGKNFFFPRASFVINYYKNTHWDRIDMYRQQLLYQQACVMKQFPTERFPLEPHHNISGFLKSVCQNTGDVFPREIQATITHRFRTQTDFNTWIFAAMAAHAGKAAWKEVRLNWLGHITSCVWELWQNYEKDFRRKKPFLFCLNDSPTCTEKDRERMKHFLQRIFPTRSSFEK